MNQHTLKPRNGLFHHERFVDYLPWILMLVVLVFMSLELWHEGRIWWCRLDYPIYLWTSDAWSPHTSQHLFDPYSFTHILHGVLFLWAANLLFRGRIKFAWILLFAVFGESIWEVIENSPAIIEKYRSNTASLNYVGDSITNSIGDVVSCIIGFITAYKLRFWKSLLLFVVIEVTLMLTIRDSLLINIIMLIYPVEAIKVWQAGV